MPKMRIQLKDTNGVVQSDRLVEQLIELQTGPKLDHKGWITLEATFTTIADIALFKNYIDKLAGLVPIKQKDSQQKPGTVNPYREIYQDVVEKKNDNMEAVIEYLTLLDFRFVTQQFLEERVKFKNLEEHYKDLPENLQYLIRMSRVAKDPTNDKYDFTLIFGIDIYKQTDKLVVYRDGKQFKKFKVSWYKSQANMKNKKIPLIFPKFMTIEERIKWRRIHKFLKDNKTIINKDKLFYFRYKPDIKNLEFEN